MFQRDAQPSVIYRGLEDDENSGVEFCELNQCSPDVVGLKLR